MTELDCLLPHLGVGGVKVMSTTRTGGVSLAPYNALNLGDHVGDASDKVLRNRELLIDTLDQAPTIHWLRQVHGTTVVEVPAVGALPEADAAWTTERGHACAIMTADCLPIVLVDKQAHCIAAVHGGWRGLAAGVLEATVETLPVSAQSLLAWFGPAISAAAFEVGAEVLDAFNLSADDEAVITIPDKPSQYFLDLNIIAKRKLIALGLSAEGISGGEHCTFGDSKRFFSHRRDGLTGRMVTLAWLTH